MTANEVTQFTTAFMSLEKIGVVSVLLLVIGGLIYDKRQNKIWFDKLVESFQQNAEAIKALQNQNEINKKVFEDHAKNGDHQFKQINERLLELHALLQVFNFVLRPNETNTNTTINKKNGAVNEKNDAI